MTCEYYLDKKSFTIMWAKQRIVMIALFIANYLVLCLVGLSIVFFPKYFYFALACIMALAMFQGGLWFCARMSGSIRMFGNVKASHEGNGIILLETETNGSVAKKMHHA